MWGTWQEDELVRTEDKLFAGELLIINKEDLTWSVAGIVENGKVEVNCCSIVLRNDANKNYEFVLHTWPYGEIELSRLNDKSILCKKSWKLTKKSHIAVDSKDVTQVEIAVNSIDQSGVQADTT